MPKPRVQIPRGPPQPNPVTNDRNFNALWNLKQNGCAVGHFKVARRGYRA